MVKISIITVCYNSERTIKDTINSVASQKYPEIEHIVVDGASKDSTMEIVNTLPSVSRYISEPDQGIYDAMNKGISMATGDVIGTLNADDFYTDDNVLAKVASVFADSRIDACYADLVYVDQFDVTKIVRFWESRPYASGLFKQGWVPAHPTFFARKKIYEQLGSFDLSYKIAADFELLLRFIEKNKIRTMYLPNVLVSMRLGGTTNKSIFNLIKQNLEIINILKTYYPDFSFLNFSIQKITNRFQQYTCKPGQ